MASKSMPPPIPTIGAPDRATWSIRLEIKMCYPAPILCLSSLFFLITVQVAGKQCPISPQRASTISFTGVKQFCDNLDSSKSASCDACLCSLTDVIIPALRSSGFDLESTGGFAGAQSILQACLITLASPLAAVGVSLTSLLGLSQCPFDKENVPGCIQEYVTAIPDPMVNVKEPIEDPKEQPHGATDEERFVEEVAAECVCPSHFDPVCDYNGYWFTNYCVAKCKGANVVEHCYPVFQTVVLERDPFVLYEKHAPLSWKAGCGCGQTKKDVNPVCDIDGRQYTSPCYAKCLGVDDVLDCGSLVVDFVLSGDGPIVEEPKIEVLDGQASGTFKPSVVDIIDTYNFAPPSDLAIPPSPQSAPEPALPPEVAATFQQLGVDVASFPPELMLMAYKIIMGEQITDDELERAKEILSDEERMMEARTRLSPIVITQLEIIAARATGNNKALLDELRIVLKGSSESSGSKESQSLRVCLENCRENKPICSALSGEEYASACHARCTGVTDTRPCYYHEESGASCVSLAAVCSTVTFLGVIVTMQW